MLDLTHDRWQRLDRLLAEALDREPDERTAFLRARCGDDPALYREAVALLARVARAERDFGESATGFAAPLLEARAAPALADGTVIGAYRVTGELGRGGMGVVYRAARADGAFEKAVALKLVKRGMDTDAVLGRFRRERRILAGLDHPGIARLLDAGAAEDGRPYLVMELVEGQPLTDWAEQRGLSLDARLALFEAACEAVAYAHRRLVVHRDLKPSNVLVAEDDDGDPQVKLLDFGIARLLDPEAREAMTQTGTPRPLTPAYAAPEQLRGEPVTTATDVYALGVVLYELLTGQRPSAPARPPSAALTDEAVHRRLRGDLDTICLKALREAPEERYPTVEALLEDLRRHRARLPVQARPASVGYHARRFVQRHRVGVAATALVLVSLVGGLGAALWQARARAAEAERAEAVQALVLDLFTQADPQIAQGDTLTAFDLVRQGASRIRETLAGQPDLQAEMLLVLAEVYEELGAYDEALPLLEDALALRRTLHEPEHARTAEVLGRLGAVHMEQGDFDRADSLLTETLRLRRARLGEEHPEVAETLFYLAALRGTGRQGRNDESVALHREALAIRERTLDEGHPDRFEALRGLALALFNQGAEAEAAPLLRDLLWQQRRHLGDRHPETIETMNVLGATLGELEEDDEAVALLREAATLREAVLGGAHPDVAAGLFTLAVALHNRQRPEDHAEVEALHRRALAIRRATLGDEHPLVATSLASLSLALTTATRYDEAVPPAREALALHRRTLGEEHPRLAVDLLFLARALFESGAVVEAYQRFREAHALALRTWPTDHRIVGDVLVHHGEVLQRRGRPVEAEPMLVEGLRILDVNDVEADHPIVTGARLRLGLCLASRAAYDAAEPLLRAAHDALEHQGETTEDLAEARAALAALYDAWGRPEQARAYR